MNGLLYSRRARMPKLDSYCCALAIGTLMRRINFKFIPRSLMADQSLLLLLKDVRKTTIDLLYGVTDDQARFAAPGLVNTILWHAGHALVVVEHLGVASL